MRALFLLLCISASASGAEPVHKTVLKQLAYAEKQNAYEMSSLAGSIVNCPSGSGLEHKQVQASLEKNIDSIIAGSSTRVRGFSAKILHGVPENHLRYTDIHCGSRTALASDLEGRRHELEAEKKFFDRVKPEIRKEADRIRGQYKAQAERHNSALCRFFHDRLIFTTAVNGKDLEALHTKRRNPDSFIRSVNNPFRITYDALEKWQKHLGDEEALLEQFEKKLTEQCPQ